MKVSNLLVDMLDMPRKTLLEGETFLAQMAVVSLPAPRAIALEMPLQTLDRFAALWALLQLQKMPVSENDITISTEKYLLLKQLSYSRLLENTLKLVS